MSAEEDLNMSQKLMQGTPRHHWGVSLGTSSTTLYLSPLTMPDLSSSSFDLQKTPDNGAFSKLYFYIQAHTFCSISEYNNNLMSSA